MFGLEHRAPTERHGSSYLNAINMLLLRSKALLTP